MILNSNLVFHFTILAAETHQSGFWPIALTIAGSVLILAVGVLISAVLITLLYRNYRRRLSVEKWLQIRNDGNTRSVFHLRPDAGSTAVSSVLLYEGRPLTAALVPAPRPSAPVMQSAPRPLPQAAVSVEPEQDHSSVTQPVAAKSSPKQPSEAAKAAKQAKKEAMGAVAVGRKAGGIIGALGSLLPGDLGKSFKEQSTQIQTATQKASKAIEEPEEKKQRLEHIQKEMKGLSGKKAKPAAPAAQMASSEQVNHAPSPVAASAQRVADQPGQAVAQAQPPVEQPRWIPEKGAYQTPSLEPGQNMRIKLELSPLNIYRSVSVPLCLKSKQVDEIQPEPTQPANTSEAWQQIAVPGLPVYKSIQSILVNVLITAINAFWVIVLIKWFIGAVL